MPSTVGISGIDFPTIASAASRSAASGFSRADGINDASSSKTAVTRAVEMFAGRVSAVGSAEVVAVAPPAVAVAAVWEVAAVVAALGDWVLAVGVASSPPSASVKRPLMASCARIAPEQAFDKPGNGSALVPAADAPAVDLAALGCELVPEESGADHTDGAA
ncbi:MAG: hypothetical protein ABI034_03820 [Nakamurella sp.]